MCVWNIVLRSSDELSYNPQERLPTANFIFTKFTLLLSDLVKLLSQVFIVSLVVCSQTLTLFQQPSNMCNVALHLTDKSFTKVIQL